MSKKEAIVMVLQPRKKTRKIYQPRYSPRIMAISSHQILVQTKFLKYHQRKLIVHPKLLVKL